jgi:hypothetical protein
MPWSSTIPRIARLFAATACLMAPGAALAEPSPMNRIESFGQPVFLSGANVAWIHFARDIGAGATDVEQFEQVFRELRANGGNSMRLWLHTTGEFTPEWKSLEVVGPGSTTINDLRQILDAAERQQVSLMLCLWSFDMMRLSNGERVTDRSHALLTDPAKLQTYLDRALTPMARELKGHRAILAWEIFNEAEGMSHEFGWNFNRRVSMKDIQRFVNRAAGTIRRADPGAKVTNGAWSFLAQTDVLDDQHAMNYYRDDRLIEAGGDRQGVLDFYTVHYYDWGKTKLSPFHHDASHWQLDKPVVVAEFFLRNDIFGIAKENLYQTLFDRGYAGALGWQWVDYAQKRDNNEASWPAMLVNMRSLQQRPSQETEVAEAKH